MANGLDAEKKVIEVYTSATGSPMPTFPACIRHPRRDDTCYSPDAIQPAKDEPEGEDTPKTLLEVKCTKDWKLYSKPNAMYNKYKHQIQLGMVVCGCTEAILIIHMSHDEDGKITTPKTGKYGVSTIDGSS